ncbi:hypothetical protein ACFYV5_33610 [Streptomyces sp. NPDC003035]|uniref:hypothetical protein n=1 Tax=Streptomyces sp. NPDC003035 TaxID=3364676 RepID=UPI0036A9B217
MAATAHSRQAVPHSTGTIDGGSLEVSYDDGATWRKGALRSSSVGPAWTGEPRVPDGAWYVSLRVGASDDRGGAATQELLRAVGVT